MTLPTLIAKHQKQVTVNKLKKAYSALSQMVARTYADNGPVSDFFNSGEMVNTDKTKEFFETYWLPYFNAPVVANPRFYNNKTLVFKKLNRDPSDINIYTDYSNGRILFSTQDGIFYNVWIMDWKRDEEGNNLGEALYDTTQTVYVDINGNNAPNTYGKDVFIFRIDFKNNIVKADCSSKSDDFINESCKKDGDGGCCAAKIMQDSWQITSEYPW